jgi:hypothetical protein
MKKAFIIIAQYKKPAVWLLLIANLVMAGGYAYAVNRTVFNVVATTKAQKNLAEVNTSIADLESHYITVRNKITLDFAYSQGFQDASKKQIFIAKKTQSSSLSFNAI